MIDGSRKGKRGAASAFSFTDFFSKKQLDAKMKVGKQLLKCDIP